jgi:hypothetical protein
MWSTGNFLHVLGAMEYFIDSGDRCSISKIPYGFGVFVSIPISF